MQYLLVLDSFKGSISSLHAAESVKRGLGGGEIIPVSDGGEGFTESVFYLLGGEFVSVDTTDSYGKPITAKYLRVGNTAYIETACADGIVTVGGKNKSIVSARSVGTGETILHALKSGCKRLVIGFGGSAVNDGGTGALYALGAKFYTAEGKEALPGGLCGEEADYIDVSGVSPLIKEAEVVFACDVTNPFYGENGASLVFSPQKGADTETALRMDKSHERLARLIENATGKDIAHIPGSGAAGGLTGGLAAVCSPTFVSGFDIIASLAGLEQKISEADVVITGEGKTDATTLQGKLPCRVIQRAKAQGKKSVCVSGIISPEANKLFADMLISLVGEAVTVEESLKNPALYLEQAGKYIKDYFEGDK